MAVRSQLVEILSEQETLSASDLDRSVQLHLAQGGSFAEILVQESILEEDDLFFLMSRRLGVPAIPEERLLHLTLSPELQIRVPRSFAISHRLVPLDLDRNKGLLSVAIFDPTDWDTLELLRESSKVAEIKCYLARRRIILEALESIYTEEEDPHQQELMDQLPPLQEDLGSSSSEGQGSEDGSFTPGYKALPESGLREKVEIDPGLAQEIAILEEQADQIPTSEHSLDEFVTLPPEQLEPGGRGRPRVAFSESVTLVRRVEGRSLLKQGRDEEGTNPFGVYPPPDDLSLEYIDYQVDSLPSDLESLPPESDSLSSGFDPLSTSRIGSLMPDPLDEMAPLPAGPGNEEELLEDEITSVTNLVHTLDMAALPDVKQMEDLDALLKELLSSVGVLVSMLEERIDPVGGSYREYGRICRLVARELGMDENTINRISLAAHLYGLDIALRSELGINTIPDVTSTFSAQPSAPGGLGPSLRMLGAKALGLTEGGNEDLPGVVLIRLVADYLELNAELEEGAHEVETVAQLLRTSGGDPLMIDALVRAMESAKTSRRRITATTRRE